MSSNAQRGTRDKQAHVVRHEDIGVHLAPGSASPARQVVQEELVIRLGVEARLPVVATLNDVDLKPATGLASVSALRQERTAEKMG